MASDPRPAEGLTEKAAGGPGGRRILVVDDEPEMLSLLCAVLRGGQREAQVDGVGSPQDALKMDERTPYDLVVTDYKMPLMNGLELSRHLRQRRPSVPIILLTAYSDARLQNQAFLARVNVFLNKPVDPRELLREVQRALAAS